MPSAKLNCKLPKDIDAKRRYGSLSVLDRVTNDASARVRVRCLCDCGTEHIVRATDLRTGHTKSCGCRRGLSEYPHGLVLRDFGSSLKAFGPVEEIHRNQYRPSTKMIVGCSFCHKVSIVRVKELLNGRSKCNCLKELYGSYRNMIQRCTNQRHPQFKDYGGRGIEVCSRWRENFQNFAKDMYPKPSGTTLDRIDPDGNYTRPNCRWANAETQAQNRRPRVSVA